MNLLEVLASYVEARRYDESPSKPEWPDDREKLWLLLGEAETIRQAASELESDLKSAFAAQLVENETVRYGEKVYKVSPKRTTRITDPKAMAEWLADDWELVVPFSPSVGDKLKTTGLKAVCERRGVEFETIRDTFLETEWDDEMELKAIPMSRAPKYAQALDHGDSTIRGKS